MSESSSHLRFADEDDEFKEKDLCGVVATGRDGNCVLDKGQRDNEVNKEDLLEEIVT